MRKMRRSLAACRKLQPEWVVEMVFDCRNETIPLEIQRCIANAILFDHAPKGALSESVGVVRFVHLEDDCVAMRVYHVRKKGIDFVRGLLSGIICCQKLVHKGRAPRPTHRLAQ